MLIIFIPKQVKSVTKTGVELKILLFTCRCIKSMWSVEEKTLGQEIGINNDDYNDVLI